MNAHRHTIRDALLTALEGELQEMQRALTDLEGLVKAARDRRPEVAGRALHELYDGEALDPWRASLMAAERHYHDLCREHQCELADQELDAAQRVLGGRRS